MARLIPSLSAPLLALCLQAQVPPPAPPAAPAPWTVRVTAPDAAPVQHATVWLLGEKGEPLYATVLTDDKGEVRLAPPKEGTFRIRVGKGGFRNKEATLKTSLQEAPPVVVQLEASA